ncbi:hypothetical protein [Fuscovulum blasticum]|uniref:hypothetical protein n=1 Tax=Fuscovulum blasticum TaxID=1075 RepID=UPI000D3E07DA|nr:hypothetical protein [Fuscovulum blasticum]AWD21625.1 hypothetical protein B6K69_07995 [Fuscovulum blasticum]
MRLAEIETGVVVNVIEVDPQAVPDWAGGWPEITEGGPGWMWDGGNFAPPPGPDAATLLAQAQAAARLRLTAAITRARTALITDLPGQDMIYLAKEAEARAWLADPVPDPAAYPLLVAEIGITAPDAPSLAQLWLNLAALWRQTAAELEGLRMAVGAAIDAATTPEDVAAALAPLDALGEDL